MEIAGISKGDIIFSFNGQHLGSYYKFMKQTSSQAHRDFKLGIFTPVRELDAATSDLAFMDLMSQVNNYLLSVSAVTFQWQLLLKNGTARAHKLESNIISLQRKFRNDMLVKKNSLDEMK